MKNRTQDPFCPRERESPCPGVLKRLHDARLAEEGPEDEIEDAKVSDPDFDILDEVINDPANAELLSFGDRPNLLQDPDMELCGRDYSQIRRSGLVNRDIDEQLDLINLDNDGMLNEPDIHIRHRPDRESDQDDDSSMEEG